MLDALRETLLFEGVLPNVKADLVLPGSTDVGDVSYITPTAQITTCCEALGTPGHSWQTVATSGSSIGFKGMMVAAKVLALTALDLQIKPDLLQAARQEFEKNTADNQYTSPLPKGAVPQPAT
jgi:aminobenzoyl-glutamate utilization protein B